MKVLVALLAWSCCCPIISLAEDKQFAEVLERCQGVWERYPRSSPPILMMEFRGNVLTITTTFTRMNEKTVFQSEYDVKLRTTENLTFLIQENHSVIQGDLTGFNEIKEPIISIRKFRNEKWSDGTTTEMLVLTRGVFNDSKSAPRLTKYVRVQNKVDNEGK